MAWTQASGCPATTNVLWLYPGPIGLPMSRGKQWLFWEVCGGLGRGGRDSVFGHSYLKTVNGQVQGLGRGGGLSWD